MSFYATSDWHGYYDLYPQVKRFLKPEDKIYFLGDAGDRGPNGWKLIKEIYYDKQFVYLKGNHEEMLCEAMHGDSYLCYANGGKSTFYGWRKETENKMNWYYRLTNLPEEVIYYNKFGARVILSHAGYTPDVKITEREKDLLWNRDHFLDPWPPEYEDTIIVHGHTSLTYFDYFYPGYVYDKDNTKAFWYSDGHKVNIDCGTASSYKTLLLNLDTFEEHVFEV